MERTELLKGWGRTQPVVSEVVELDGTPAAADVFVRPGTIARGLGRAYGDAAQIGGGRVVTQPDEVASSSLEEGGVLHAGGGASLDSILSAYVPKGWFVPVTPGTRYVTVGGAIAADIHGKNHHVEGTFSNHVAGFELLTPTGERRVSRDDDPELFWATAGGMGLTGIITSARFQMIPVESAYMKVETRRLDDLDSLMATMVGSDHKFRYSVAWIDCLARGRYMGRSVLTRGDHAQVGDLKGAMADDPLNYQAKPIASAPPWLPGGLLNNASVRLFNEMWFRKAPRLREGEIQRIPTFFHPLDGVGGWNRIYGPRGFLQYQFVVPDGQEEAMRRILEKIASAQVPSFLAVLKRFGAANPGLLSFPRPGWTLALDIPVGSPRLFGLLESLDKQVLEASGRLYLAKDSRAKAETIAAMYPRLGELAAVKAKVDPEGLIKSDLSRRLGIA
ncbi:MAG: FAD-binding oxidoreductase [Actinomycetota bacterium]|nr:FAD-binding oxidoreductase [Actinomycetota bacterium]